MSYESSDNMSGFDYLKYTLGIIFVLWLFFGILRAAYDEGQRSQYYDDSANDEESLTGYIN